MVYGGNDRANRPSIPGFSNGTITAGWGHFKLKWSLCDLLVEKKIHLRQSRRVPSSYQS